MKPNGIFIGEDKKKLEVDFSNIDPYNKRYVDTSCKHILHPSGIIHLKEKQIKVYLDDDNVPPIYGDMYIFVCLHVLYCKQLNDIDRTIRRLCIMLQQANITMNDLAHGIQVHLYGDFCSKHYMKCNHPLSLKWKQNIGFDDTTTITVFIQSSNLLFMHHLMHLLHDKKVSLKFQNKINYKGSLPRQIEHATILEINQELLGKVIKNTQHLTLGFMDLLNDVPISNQVETLVVYNGFNADFEQFIPEMRKLTKLKQLNLSNIKVNNEWKFLRPRLSVTLTNCHLNVTPMKMVLKHIHYFNHHDVIELLTNQNAIKHPKCLIPYLQYRIKNNIKQGNNNHHLLIIEVSKFTSEEMKLIMYGIMNQFITRKVEFKKILNMEHVNNIISHLKNNGNYLIYNFTIKDIHSTLIHPLLHGLQYFQSNGLVLTFTKCHFLDDNADTLHKVFINQYNTCKLKYLDISKTKKTPRVDPVKICRFLVLYPHINHIEFPIHPTTKNQIMHRIRYKLQVALILAKWAFLPNELLSQICSFV